MTQTDVALSVDAPTRVHHAARISPMSCMSSTRARRAEALAAAAVLRGAEEAARAAAPAPAEPEPEPAASAAGNAKAPAATRTSTASKRISSKRS